MSNPDDTQKVPAGRSIRLERATLGVNVIAGAAVMLGAYFYVALVSAQKDMLLEMRGVRDALSAMDRRVSVLEAPGLDARMRELDRRVTTLEAKAGR